MGGRLSESLREAEESSKPKSRRSRSVPVGLTRAKPSNSNLNNNENQSGPKTNNHSPSSESSSAVGKPKKVKRKTSSNDLKKTPLEPLTASQKALVKKSWDTRFKFSTDNIGIRAYIKVMEKCPEVKKMFFLSGISSTKLIFNQRLRSQADSFIRVIEDTVSQLENMNGRPRNRLYALGERHILYGGGKFQVKYWDIFAESILECVIESQGVQSGRGLLASWRNFISWIIGVMKEGYYNALKKEKSMEYAEDSTDDPSTSSRKGSSFSTDKKTIHFLDESEHLV